MTSTAPAPRAASPTSLRFTTTLRYTERASKAMYIADKYAAILIGSVLDVGCDAAPLRKLVHEPFRYVGVDFQAGADVVLDLDKQDLPFPDRHFDTVLCTDVLEHLERSHAVLDELCRVARKHVIVSLPNPLRNLMLGLFYDKSGGRLKYYGLPVERPEDRHRWFFGREEAAEFLSHRGRRAGFEVEQLDSEEGDCPVWRDEQGRNVLDHPNLKGGTIWCVLRRAAAGPVASGRSGRGT